MKESMKKTTKIVGSAMAVIMLIGTIGTMGFFGSNNKNTNEVTSKDIVASEQLVEHSIADIEKNIIKKDINVKKDVVQGSIVVNENVNMRDAQSLINKYVSDLKEKNKGKKIDVKIVRNNEDIAKTTIYNDVKVKPEKGVTAPKATVKIENGLTVAERYVAITLDTDKSQNYNVKVFDKNLKYVPEKKMFHGLVEVTNEDSIKSNIKISNN